jgi:hypothetical protein
MVASPTGLGPENECDGEGQQQLLMTGPSFRQRGCHIRTMAAVVQLREIILTVSLKELGAKKSCLALNL